ncbi:MAG: relaxase/mobilization nuclease domain-containing protein [Pseudomonadota bacterium]
MVPKLHKKGSSFKGAAAYLLQDKEAATSERVAWTATHNLAVDDPEIAWRVMAATALDQDRLKQEAGVKSTGRKSSAPVLHLTLAWHPEEKATLTREEMEGAVRSALRALDAGDHQALVIAHNDEAHPHLHILINRVHPVDGRMLSSSKEKLKLSEWAQGYEEERGRIFCEERVLNNDARDRGEFTRGEKDVDRRVFEEMRAARDAANDNVEAVEAQRRRQAERDAEIAREERALVERHRAEWRRLIDDAHERAREARTEHLKRASREIDEARKARRPEWKALAERHRLERKEFERREETVSGSLKNAISLRDVSYDPGTPRTPLIARLFGLASSRATRFGALEKRQRTERQALEVGARREEQVIRNSARQRLAAEGRLHRDRFLDERERLIERHDRERLNMREAWRLRRQERSDDWRDFARKEGLRDRVRADFAQAVGGDRKKQRDEMRERIKVKFNADRDRER